MKGVGFSKAWWRLFGIFMILGIFSATVFIGYWAWYLYVHLQWES